MSTPTHEPTPERPPEIPDEEALAAVELVARALGLPGFRLTANEQGVWSLEVSTETDTP